MTPFEEARLLAENYIDYAARTRAEVERRLRKAEYDEELISDVLADLERGGLLNDAEFSQAWVESRARSKKLGKVRLAAELRQKGVSKEHVEEAMEQLGEEDELNGALALAEKRIGAHGALMEADPAERRRLAAYLQRRGYKWQTIEQVFARIFANSD